MKKLLKLPEVIKKTCMCRTTIYSMINEGKFPKQIKLRERSVAWVEEEVDNWIKDKIKERNDGNV